MTPAQVLTADQMRAAEQRLFDAGTSVGELMEIAAGGAAEWVRRLAAGRKVTVLCGPGNNGGDGYVIARRLKQWGLAVQIVAPVEPKTQAAKDAKAAWGGPVLTSGGQAKGEVGNDGVPSDEMRRSEHGPGHLVTERAVGGETECSKDEGAAPRSERSSAHARHDEAGAAGNPH